MSAGLTFDKATHTYTLDGRPIPSVTQILRDVGIIDTSAPWYTEEARDLGSRVAIATHWHDWSVLDGDNPDFAKLERLAPDALPYVKAWCDFLNQTHTRVIKSEVAVSNRVLRYAGTYDRLIDMNGKTYLIDIKTGRKENWHGLQTAAYAGALQGYMLRGAVYLSADGKWKFEPHNDPDDWPAFQAACSVWHWKEKHAR